MNYEQIHKVDNKIILKTPSNICLNRPKTPFEAFFTGVWFVHFGFDKVVPQEAIDNALTNELSFECATLLPSGYETDYYYIEFISKEAFDRFNTTWAV